jgi:hypothetical protein
MRRRLLWTLSISLMTIGTMMIAYALFVPAWSNDALAYVLTGLLLGLYVIVQTIVAMHAEQPVRRQRKERQ